MWYTKDLIWRAIKLYWQTSCLYGIVKSQHLKYKLTSIRESVTEVIISDQR